MAFTAYDYGHVYAALQIGLKGAEDSCNVTDSEKGQIEYAIKLMNLERENICGVPITKEMQDYFNKYGTE